MISSQCLFSDGRKDGSVRELSDIAAKLRREGEKLRDISVEDILDFFDALGTRIEREKDLGRKTGVGFGDLVHFLRKENLGKSLDLSLRGTRGYLDKFLKPDGFDFYLHAEPRGLVVEWLAGNIPFLGMYSMAEVLATKNSLLIKAPQNNFDILLGLLTVASEIASENEAWKQIVSSVTVVLAGREERDVHEELSRLADVRVIWGGEKSVNAILSLKKNFWTEDIVYGPKYSYALLDQHTPKERIPALAGALAVDVANFDQYACSSPHAVFIEQGAAITPLQFGGLLAKELERVSRLLIPKSSSQPETIMKVVTARADYALKGEVLTPEGGGTDWTVIVTDEKGLPEAICSRTIFVKPVGSLDELTALNDRRIQTIGYAGKLENEGRDLIRLTSKGVDRLPEFGKTSFFASPWDGMFAADRLVRWVRFH